MCLSRSASPQVWSLQTPSWSPAGCAHAGEFMFRATEDPCIYGDLRQGALCCHGAGNATQAGAHTLDALG